MNDCKYNQIQEECRLCKFWEPNPNWYEFMEGLYYERYCRVFFGYCPLVGTIKREDGNCREYEPSNFKRCSNLDVKDLACRNCKFFVNNKKNPYRGKCINPLNDIYFGPYKFRDYLYCCRNFLAIKSEEQANDKA